MTTNEAMTELLKTLIYKKLQVEANQISHTNKDGYYSPSRWWYDAADTSLGGKILNTEAQMYVYKNDDLEVTVKLDYSTRPR